MLRRTLHRTLRGCYGGRYGGRCAGRHAGCCADIARLAALFFNKGMVSSKNQGFQVSESRNKSRSPERIKLDDDGRTDRAF